MPGHLARLAAASVASVTLVAGALVLAAPSASSSTLAPRASVPLDHFLCYHVTAKGFKVPPVVQLKNFLEPLFTPKIGVVATHCNPATKQVQYVTGLFRSFPSVNPNAHLLCWSITYQYTPRVVNLQNQFGSAVMLTSPGPKSLCLPTWKNRYAAPNKAPRQPPRLDHFTCYGLQLLSKTQYHFAIPSLVKVEDEFSAPAFTRLTNIALANQLCVPTVKVVAGKVYAPQGTADLSLVCYPTIKTPYWKSFFDQNQFGAGAVYPSPPVSATGLPFEELCLPTLARLG